MPPLPPPPADLLDDHLLLRVPVREGYKVLGPVVLYRRLGKGGMGTVYVGHHLRFARDVAVKCLSHDLAEDEQFVRRFLEEARSAVDLGHQNIVRVFDVGEEHRLHYLVMEFVDGESAGDRLKRKGPLPEREALTIVLGAAQGLAHAHAKGFVHRDVKPDNLLISRQGEVKVADLGLAKPVGDSGRSLRTGSGAAFGTPAFMPPEQARSARSVGFPADVYALGATLYALLTGSAPYRGEMFDVLQQVVQEPFPEVRAKRPEVSLETAALIQRCCAKDPAARPADAREFVRILRLLLKDDETALADHHSGGLGETKPVVSPPPSGVTPRAEEAGTDRVASERLDGLADPRPRPRGARLAAVVALCVLLGASAWLSAILLEDQNEAGARPTPPLLSAEFGELPASEVEEAAEVVIRPSTSHPDREVLSAVLSRAEAAHAAFLADLAAARSIPDEFELVPEGSASAEGDAAAAREAFRREMAPALTEAFERSTSIVDAAATISRCRELHAESTPAAAAEVDACSAALAEAERVFLAASDQLKEARPVVLALGALAQADAGPMALGIDWSPLAGRGEPLLAPLRSEHQDLQQLLGRGELRAALPAIATLSRKHLILAAAVARLGPSVSMAARWGGMARRLEAAGGASYTPPEELGGRCPEAWRRAETGDLEHWEAELSAVAADLDRRASAAQELLALDEELLSELQAWDSTVPLSVVGAGGQQLALAREQVRLAAAERDEILRETCTGPLAVALSAPARLRAAHEALRTTLGALDLARPQLVASGPEPGTYVCTALPEIWLQFDEALSRITIEGIEMELDAERRTGRLRLELGEGRDSIPYCATDLVGNESRDELPIKIVAVLVPPWAELVAERPDPAVVTDAEGRRRMEETGLAWKVRDRVSGIAMHLVPPGIYMRGASPDDPDPDGDEVPAHQVQVSSPFYLGETEVTNQQWATIAGTEAPAGEKANLPASGLSYEEIVAVLEPIGLRLPREAEWEYACRAGSILMHYGSLEEIGWTRSNSELTLRPVGQLRANAWGFKDMIGSVWEWCSTCYRADRYATLASRPMPLDARVDDEIQYLEDSWELVLRGGCWWEYSRDASASGRMGSYSFERWGVGCRVARDP